MKQAARVSSRHLNNYSSVLAVIIFSLRETTPDLNKQAFEALASYIALSACKHE